MARKPKTLRLADATTRKLCSPASVWQSTRPNKYRDAIQRIDDLAKSLDENVAVKACVYIIDQCNGKANQKVDITSGGDKLTAPIVNVMNPEQQKKILDFNKTLDAI